MIKIPPLTNAGQVPDDDLRVLEELVQQHSVQTVLEFGPGRSTYAFLQAGCRVWSYEYQALWLTRMQRRFTENECLVLDTYTNTGPIVFDNGDRRYDLAFVDSPVQSQSPGWPVTSRLATTMAAASVSDRVLLHDARRTGERATAKVMQNLGWSVSLIPTKLGLFLFEKEVDA